MKWSTNLASDRLQNLENDLLISSEQKNFKILAYVIMSNHLHLIAEASKAEKLEIIFPDIEMISSFQIEQRSWAQLKETLKYIYRNPTEAGLSVSPQTYPFSSLQVFLGLKRRTGFIQDPLFTHLNAPTVLNWLSS